MQVIDKRLQFTLRPEELTFWSSVEKKWVQEAETFDLWVGGDSTAALHTTFTII